MNKMDTDEVGCKSDCAKFYLRAILEEQLDEKMFSIANGERARGIKATVGAGICHQVDGR